MKDIDFFKAALSYCLRLDNDDFLLLLSAMNKLKNHDDRMYVLNNIDNLFIKKPLTLDDLMNAIEDNFSSFWHYKDFISSLSDVEKKRLAEWILEFKKYNKAFNLYLSGAYLRKIENLLFLIDLFKDTPYLKKLLKKLAYVLSIIDDENKHYFVYSKHHADEIIKLAWIAIKKYRKSF